MKFRYFLILILCFVTINISNAKTYDFSDEATETFMQQYHTLNIPGGAMIYSRLNSNISSEQNTSNEEITTQLIKDWTYKSRIVAPEGSLIKGRISSIQNSGYATSNAKVNVTFYQIIRPDNSIINILSKPICITVGNSQLKNGTEAMRQGILQNLTRTRNLRDIPDQIVAGAIAGGFTFISTKGEEVNIPFGTEFRINIISNVITTEYEN